MLWFVCIYFELTPFTEEYFFDMIDMIRVNIEGVNQMVKVYFELNDKDIISTSKYFIVNDINIFYLLFRYPLVK